MTVEFTVEIADDDAAALEKFDNARICDELVEALQELASVSNEQDELRAWIDVDQSPQSQKSDGSEVSTEEQQDQLKAFLHRDRKDGIQK